MSRNGYFTLVALFWAIILAGTMAITPGRRRILMPEPVPRASPERCEVTGCGDRGTCNAVEGVCRCQYGFRGRTCNEYILRSCHFGPTDYDGWRPPAVAPGLAIVLDNLRPASCACLSEVVEANGRRGIREISPETECFVRVPERHVSLSQLMLMQHSGWTVDDDQQRRVSLNFRDFRLQDFYKACHSNYQNPLMDGPAACRSLAQAYERGFQRPSWERRRAWLPDAECAKQVQPCREAALASGLSRGVPQGQGGQGNRTASCCGESGSRCVVVEFDKNNPTVCMCGRGYVGQRCELPCQIGCINECSGNGECFASWCKCKPGWFGIDCSLPADSAYPEPRPVGSALPPPPPPPKHVSELKIYVYDVPPEVLQAEPSESCSDLDGGLYSSNQFFLARLMRDRGHLTTNPDEAHLFYAPLLAYRFSQNGGRSSPHIRDTLDMIRDMGYFDRNGGRDHMWYVIGDIQTCQVTHLVQPGIIIGHYGRLDTWNTQWNHNPNHTPCMNPHKDLVVPALSPASRAMVRVNPPGSPHHVSYLQPPAVQQAQEAFADGWMDQPRPTLLFFAGNNPSLRNQQCDDPNDDTPLCRDGEYAMGIRAAFFKWFRENAAGMPDVEILDKGIGELYFPKLRSTKFCLDTSGFGFSVRILEYVASGCIPVILRDDVLWPYESYEYKGDDSKNWQQDSLQGVWDDLPRVHYPEFAITLHKRDIPNILSMLRGISNERLRHLQEGVQRIHKAFLWDEEYGLAYNYTLMVLARLRANVI